jgi:hypothetical protein
MKKKAVRLLVWSQVIFILTILVCFVINPEVVLKNYALSVYGTQLKTVVPYAVGFVVSAFLVVKTAQTLPKDTLLNRRLSRLLLVLAVLLLGVLLTPFTLNSVFWHLHGYVTFALFITELGTGLWLVIKTREDLLDIILYTAQVTGFIVSILSLGEISILHFLVFGQLIAVCGFAGLLTRAVSRIEQVKI